MSELSWDMSIFFVIKMFRNDSTLFSPFLLQNLYWIYVIEVSVEFV